MALAVIGVHGDRAVREHFVADRSLPARRAGALIHTHVAAAPTIRVLSRADVAVEGDRGVSREVIVRCTVHIGAVVTLADVNFTVFTVEVGVFTLNDSAGGRVLVNEVVVIDATCVASATRAAIHFNAHGRASRVGAGRTVHAGAASEFVHVEVTVVAERVAHATIFEDCALGVLRNEGMIAHMTGWA